MKKNAPVRIAPSILSADFARLGDAARAVERGGAALLHVDVMDGHFVPNITMGPVVVKALRKATKLTLDVHLMIEEPDRYVPSFIEAGAGMVSVHYEACRHLHRTLGLIRSLGAKAGVAVNPATPASFLDPVLGHLDYVLLMSVNPGFGGQEFIPETLDKARALKRLFTRRRLHIPIEMDGGIGKSNIARAAEAGVEIMVAGTSVFGQPDPGRAVAELLAAAGRSHSRKGRAARK